MKYDDVVEHEEEVSSSKSWSAEREGVATWSRRSGTEGAAGQIYGAEGTNLTWERVDNGSDFIPDRKVIKSYGQDLFASRVAINT